MNTWSTAIQIVGTIVAIVYFSVTFIILFFRKARPICRFGPFLIFILAIFLDFIPTPGAWSDIRSQWLPAAVALFLLIFIFFGSFLY